MKVDPANVRSGADKVGGAHSDVAKISVPDSSGASAGLTGFVTAGVLSGAMDASRSSLSVMGGRFEEMQQLLRRSADSYEHQDNKTAVSLSDFVGTSMSSMGDLNGAS